MTAPRLDFDVFRNATRSRELQICDNLDVPIDLTGTVFDGEVTATPGGAHIANIGLLVTEAVSGLLEVSFTGADFAAYGETQTLSRFPYDIRMTRAGDTTIVLAGYVNVLPGSTT